MSFSGYFAFHIVLVILVIRRMRNPVNSFHLGRAHISIDEYKKKTIVRVSIASLLDSEKIQFGKKTDVHSLQRWLCERTLGWME